MIQPHFSILRPAFWITNSWKEHKSPSFENIHIYPLICEILGLEVPEAVDGKLEVLAPILKK